MGHNQNTVSEFLGHTPPGCVALAASVEDAVTIMRDADVSCVLVMEQGSLAGIFTERDLLERVIGKNRPFDEIPIAEVMTTGPVTLVPDAHIAFAINEMAVGGFRNLPILCGDEVKLLTVNDIIRHLAELFDELKRPPIDHDTAESWIDIGGQG